MPFATNGDAYLQNVGKKMAGRLLDGRTWDEVPS
jgi:protein gp37